MPDGPGTVLAAAGPFVGAPLAPSHPLRRPLVEAFGEGAFSGLCSVVAALALGADQAAPIAEPAWAAGDGLWATPAILTLIASTPFVGSSVRNPALPGAAGRAATAKASGVQRGRGGVRVRSAAGDIATGSAVARRADGEPIPCPAHPFRRPLRRR